MKHPRTRDLTLLLHEVSTHIVSFVFVVVILMLHRTVNFFVDSVLLTSCFFVSAVYNAVGLAAYELFDNVDFDQWFKNQLLGELQVSHHR